MTRVSITRKINVRDPDLRPAWRNGMVPYEWKELAGTSLSLTKVPNVLDGNNLVGPYARVDAWNGMAVDRSTGDCYIARAGGHGDWWGNEVYKFELNVATPGQWTVLRQPSASVQSQVSHYSDGRPSSTHLYYALQFNSTRNRVMTYYSGGVYETGTSGSGYPKVDAFRLADNDWDAADTFTAMPGPAGPTPYADVPLCQHPTTLDVYTCNAGYYRRWNEADGTWDQLAAVPSGAGGDLHLGSPSAVDTTRGRVLFARNNYQSTSKTGIFVDVATGAQSTATFSGVLAANAWGALAEGMEYIAELDVYLIKTRTGGTVLRVDADTLEVTPITTTGGTVPNTFAYGVYNRFRYIPALGGCVYLPRGDGNVWFLATE